jgi:hypothetical protein
VAAAEAEDARLAAKAQVDLVAVKLFDGHGPSAGVLADPRPGAACVARPGKPTHWVAQLLVNLSPPRLVLTSRPEQVTLWVHTDSIQFPHIPVTPHGTTL